MATSTATDAAAAATRRHRVLAANGLVKGQAAYLVHTRIKNSPRNDHVNIEWVA